MLVAILSAFAGGLILNLMPCVFPVISMKAFGLMRHGGEPAKLRREGFAFFAGTLLAMLSLAGVLLALRAGGEAVGWGFQLQSPAVVAALALVMVGSALNLFGLFEFGTGLQTVGAKLDTRDGALGAALTGALAVMLATPCAGPFMAGALGYALTQPPLTGLAVFAALATGVAAPFTMLSFIPALARRLPRPGPWMVTLKRALAFPMLGAAAWLVWVLAQQTGPSGLATILGCALLLGLVCWVYGLSQQRSLSGRPARTLDFAALAGLAAIVLALALPGTGLRATGAPKSAAAVVANSGTMAFRPVVWSPARAAAERAAGRPVFVDFSAAWCLTCQLNEKAVLSTQAFRDALGRTGTVYMVADSTNYDPAIERAMAALGRTGLPLYLVYPVGGGAPVVLPQILDRAGAIAALTAATQKRT
ncbi:MAG: thioredoxin family protein [Caulobacteraceae bacterium]